MNGTKYRKVLEYSIVFVNFKIWKNSDKKINDKSKD